MTNRLAMSVLGGAALVLAGQPSEASYGFYVGKDLTESGGVLIGGTGEEVSSHWLEIVPRATHEAGETVSVGVTEAATLPGELIDIPQVPETFRYLSMFYSDYEGFPAPLTNGGVNEHQVAVRDIWATTRNELWDDTATPQKGPQYSDLARLVMERATTAREGVELIGELIAEHGYSTYGGNSHLIADPNEGWVVWEFAGGEGLWAAERLGSDEVRVLYPGYIEDFPVDFEDDPDFMGSPNLISYAEEQGWYDPDSDETFNVFEVYGRQDGPEARTGGFKYMSQADIEDTLSSLAPVSEREMMDMVRDPRIADDEAGYGQVITLEEGIDPDMIHAWVAPTGSVTAPFVPWYLGVQDVPAEFGMHRYLTKGAASAFLNPDYQQQEATDFAGRTFKQVLYYTCADPDAYLEDVVALLEGYEADSFEDREWVETTGRTLIENDERAAAQAFLTHYSTGRAMEALDLGKTMVGWLDARMKLEDAFTAPQTEFINDQGGETPNCLVGANPDVPADQQ